MPGHDRFAHVRESIKEIPGFPVREFIIGDHRNPGFKEEKEWGRIVIYEVS